MDTQNTAPVDLNAFQCGNLKMLTYLHEIVGDTEKALKFRNRFVEFKETVQRIFYDKLKKTWFDVDFKKVRRIEIDFASASAPLYTGCYDGKETTVLNFYERFSVGIKF
jgi:neutral trehalase